jgi:CheY-like chemotaxis protein
MTPQDGPADAGARTGRRVLVADDNRDSAKTMAYLLQRLGADVRTAFDGEEAVATAEAFRPDVCLLDLGMPKLDGCETARRIRGTPWGRAMTLVALTGWSQDEDRRRSQEAGFDHHVVKPVDPKSLAKLLESAWSRSR